MVKHTREPLHLGLSLSGGKGLVTLSRPVGCGPLRLELLEMEIPSIRFPFDLSGGTRRFRHRRCRLRRSALALDSAAAPAWLLRTTARAAGFRGLVLDFGSGTFHVTGRFVERDQGGPFLLRGFVQPAGDRLLVRICDTWIFSPLPLPAPLVARRLMTAAGARLEKGADAQLLGCCDLTVAPLALALRWTLPVHGWRLPATGKTQLTRADISPAGLRLEFDQRNATPPPPPERWASDLEAMERLSDAEGLLESDPDRALAIYREQLDRQPTTPFAEQRALELLVAQPEHDEETLELAGQSLSRDPESIPALLARAAVMLRQDRFAEAAAAHRRVAELCAARQDRPGETIALLAAGRSAARDAPECARHDFERVLELDHRNVTAINQLLRLAADRGDWSSLAALRQRQLDLTLVPEQRLHTHLALGELYRVHLDDPTRAFTQYQQALDLDPHCEPAIRGQAEACIDADRVEEAIDALLRLGDMMAQRGDPDEHVPVLLRLASLYEHQNQPQQALLQLERALGLRPAQPQALRQQAEILEQLGRRREAADVLIQLLQQESNAQARLTTHLQLAEVLLALDDPPAAKQQLEQALAIDPDCAVARRMAVSVAELADGPDALLDALQRALEVETDPGRRQELLLRIARQHNGDVEQAAHYLRQAAEAGLAPQRLGRAWDRLLAATDDGPRQAARIHELAAETFDGDRRAERLFDAGQLWEKEAHATEDAVRCYEAALQANPHHQGALDALEAIQTATGNREALTRTLSLKIEAAHRLPAVQKALLCRLGELLSELGRHEEGHVCFTRALALDAEYSPALVHLARQAMSTGDEEQAKRYYRRLTASLSNNGELGPEEATRLLVEAHLALAELHHGQERPQEEEAHLELALAADPRHVEVLDRLTALFTTQQRHLELVDVLKRRVEVTHDPRELAEIELKRADLLQKMPGRTDEAIAAYRNAARAMPSEDVAPLRLLTGLLRETRRHAELCDLLTQQAERAEQNGAEASAIRALWLEAASLASSRLGDRPRAVSCLRRALQHAPADPDVVAPLLTLGEDTAVDPAVLTDVARDDLAQGNTDRALLALRAALRQAKPGAERDEAARLLLDAVDGKGTAATNDVVLALDAMTEAGITPPDRWRLAGLLVERGNDERAVELLRGLPDDFDAADQASEMLVGCLRRLGRHRDLAEALERHATNPPFSLQQRRKAWVTAARIWAEKVDDPERAVAALRQAAAITPLDLALVDRAGELLLKRWPQEFTRFVEGLVADESNDETRRAPGRAALLCRAADATRRMGGSQSEIEALLQQAVRAHPSHHEALDRLIQLHAERGDDERLLDALRQRAELGSEVGPRVGALLQAAEIAADRLGRPKDAMELLGRAAVLQPEDAAILDRQVELALILGRSEQAERLLVALADRGHQVERSLKRALGLAQQRGDDAAQVNHLRRLSLLRHNDPPTLWALAGALGAHGDLDGQAAALEKLAQRDSDALLELALLQAGPLERPRAAREYLTRFLQAHPDNRRGLALLARLGRQLERPVEVAAALRRLYSLEKAPQQRAELAASIAQLEREAGRYTEEEEAWRLALKDEPGDVEFLQHLIFNLRRRQRWGELCAVLEQTLSAGHPAARETRAALALQLAETYLDNLDNEEAGLRWLQQAWQLGAGKPAVERLGRHYREQQQYAELADLLAAHGEQLEGQDLSRCLEQLAQVQEIHLKDLRAAARNYAAAYREAPDGDPRVALRAQELLVRTNQLEAALALLDEAIPRSEDKMRGELHHRRGHVLAIRGQPAEAIEEHRCALEYCPDHLGARAELGRRLFELGNYDAAVPHLEAAAALLERPTEREACAFLTQRALDKLGVATEPRKSTTQELTKVPQAADSGPAIPQREPSAEGAPPAEPPGGGTLPTVEGKDAPRTPDEWEALVTSYRQKAEESSSLEEKARLLVAVAEIMERHLDRPLDAYKIYEQAVATCPGYMPANEALADAAYRSQNWHRARELYDQLWLEGSSMSRHELSFRRGLVHETLGDEQTADLCYAHAASVNPDHRPSLEGRARVALSRDDVEGALESLEGLSRLISVDEIEELTATRSKLGELHLRVGNVEAARDCLESALSLDPTHSKVMQTLLPVYEQLGEYKALAEILERLVRCSSNPLVRASLLHYRAEVLGGALGNEEAAVSCLLKAYDLAPNYPPTLWRLIDYYWERDDLPAVAEMGANLREATDLLAESPDVRQARLAVAALVVEHDNELAAGLLRAALARPELQRAMLRELGHAVDMGVGADAAAMVDLLRNADPDGALVKELISVAEDYPEIKGLSAMVELLRAPG